MSLRWLYFDGSWQVPSVSSTYVDFATPVTNLLVHYDAGEGSTTFSGSCDFKSLVLSPTNAAQTTGTVKYGASSVFVNGNGRIQIQDDDNVQTKSFQFGLNPIVMFDVWIYPTQFTTEPMTIMHHRRNDQTAWQWGLVANTGQLHFDSINGGVVRCDVTSTGSLTLNSWNHVRLSLSGGIAVLGLNGELVASSGDTMDYDANLAAGSLDIGARATNEWFLKGYMDELYIVRNRAMNTTTGYYVLPTASWT